MKLIHKFVHRVIHNTYPQEPKNLNLWITLWITHDRLVDNLLHFLRQSMSDGVLSTMTLGLGLARMATPIRGGVSPDVWMSARHVWSV